MKKVAKKKLSLDAESLRTLVMDASRVDGGALGSRLYPWVASCATCNATCGNCTFLGACH
jgi:hypothetical protein